MEVSIQSLHVMMTETHMGDREQTAVLDTIALFRSLDGNVCAEVEHHDTKYKKDSGTRATVRGTKAK